MMRRLRLGNLRKLFADRYGDTFPDDDAGREDLRELLLPISVSFNAAKLKMRDEIERHAQWMTPVESMVLIADIVRTPVRYRMASAKALGKRLNVTNGERERLKLWTIAASNMTTMQALEFRKMKDRERKRRLRALRGN